MDVLVVGSGGREHALAWKLSQSPRLGKLYIAPGNGGTSQCGENVDIAATDIEKLVAFATEKKIGLTVVGPENRDPGSSAFKAQAKGFRPTKVADSESSGTKSRGMAGVDGAPKPSDEQSLRKMRGSSSSKPAHLYSAKGSHHHSVVEAEARFEPRLPVSRSS